MTIVSLDIDGTISEYPLHWLEFLNESFGYNFSSIDQAKKFLGQDSYKEKKDIYRRSESKYSIPIRNEFIRLAIEIYQRGGKIFINSQRPFSEYPSMLKSTSDWLNKNNFPFETIQEKSIKNLEKQQIKFHFDNEINECLRLSNIKSIKNFFLIGQDQNQGSFNSRIIEINSKVLYQRVIDLMFIDL